MAFGHDFNSLRESVSYWTFFFVEKRSRFLQGASGVVNVKAVAFAITFVGRFLQKRKLRLYHR